jgi:stage III sporulation protein AG
MWKLCESLCHDRTKGGYSVPLFSDIWSKWFPGWSAGSKKSIASAPAATQTAARRSEPPLDQASGLPPLLSSAAGRNLIILALAGALLMLLSKSGGDGRATRDQAEGEISSALEANAAIALSTGGSAALETRLAGELERLLSQVAGAGRVEVYITLETGPRQVLAEEVTTEKNIGTGAGGSETSSLIRESRKPVTVRDEATRSERPVVLVQKEPKVRGVIVLADGAGNAALRYTLAKAVATILGVDMHRVSVLSRYN